MEWRDLSTRSRDANNHLFTKLLHTSSWALFFSLSSAKKKKTKRPTTCLKLDTLLLWKFVFGARKEGTPNKGGDCTTALLSLFTFYCFSIHFFLFDFLFFYNAFYSFTSLLFALYSSHFSFHSFFYLVNPCQPFLQCYSSKMF